MNFINEQHRPLIIHLQSVSSVSNGLANVLHTGCDSREFNEPMTSGMGYQHRKGGLARPSWPVQNHAGYALTFEQPPQRCSGGQNVGAPHKFIGLLGSHAGGQGLMLGQSFA